LLIVKYGAPRSTIIFISRFTAPLCSVGRELFLSNLSLIAVDESHHDWRSQNHHSQRDHPSKVPFSFCMCPFSRTPLWHCSGTEAGDCGPKTCPQGPTASEKARMTMDERPRLTASEIEAMLLAKLQKLPSLRDTQSVRIRPYSGPKGWTWELDSIEPEVGPTQIKFVDLATVVGQLQQQYDLDLSPPPPA